MRIFLGYHPRVRGAPSRLLAHGGNHAPSAERVGYVLREP